MLNCYKRKATCRIFQSCRNAMLIWNSPKPPTKFQPISLFDIFVMNCQKAKSFPIAALQAILITYFVLECQCFTSKGLNLSSIRVPPPYTGRSNPFSASYRQRFCGGTGAYIMQLNTREYPRYDIENFGRGASVFATFRGGKSVCVGTKEGTKKFKRAFYGNCYAGCHFRKSSRMRCGKYGGRPMCYSVRGWKYKKFV